MRLSANNALRTKTRGMVFAVMVFAVIFTLMQLFPPHKIALDMHPPTSPIEKFHTYPQILDSGSFRFAIIADKDHLSQTDDGWGSVLRSGVLKRVSENSYTVDWESQIKLTTQFNEGGRGLELSELINFNGRLLSFDDRTGIVFEIIGSDVIPRYILMDGDGLSGKGFKSEWATIKGGLLYVGSMGKEWTTGSGEVLNHNPQFVKTIDAQGHVSSIDWRNQYQALRAATGTLDPGYLVHESAVWHEKQKKWYFLPRRVSKERYDEKEDENRGSNVVITADENFKSIKHFTIGTISPKHGFSSFRFIPDRPDHILALKSVEDGPKAFTYIAVFDIHGNTLMDETLIDQVKYEGLEFLSM
eukprot:TRINITY_DN9489_c0_g1_i1.p1 TRINITY_DN9489_c0_g1~~TRINITY_DN9489_c0_g1_i1.p1  ORF type:complete len:358 (+),score=57.85 TRINITY_DN9489_c0_g1_i1:157-1230(+)